MGAWGEGNFENDSALDWCFNLDNCSDTKILWEAVEVVLQEEYVDSDIATEALAALEVAAGLKGQTNPDVPEDVEKWLKDHKDVVLSDSFYERAEECINKILSTQSELKELWEESDNYQEWLNEVNDLRARLNS